MPGNQGENVLTDTATTRSGARRRRLAMLDQHGDDVADRAVGEGLASAMHGRLISSVLKGRS